MPSTLSHQIGADDYGKAERHRVQRDYFVPRLVATHQTKKLFEQLVRSNGLHQPARRLKAALRKPADQETIKAADKAFFEAVVKNRKRLGNAISEHVRELFGTYVPWLAAELLAYCREGLYAKALGKQITRRSTLAPIIATSDREPEAIEIFMPLTAGVPTANERRRAIRQRARRLQAELEARQPAVRRGRAPKRDGKTLERYAEWYYLHVVEKRSLHSLARAYRAEQERQFPSSMSSNYDGRALIQRGIEDTARRLGLPTTFPK